SCCGLLGCLGGGGLGGGCRLDEGGRRGLQKLALPVGERLGFRRVRLGVVVQAAEGAEEGGPGVQPEDGVGVGGAAGGGAGDGAAVVGDGQGAVFAQRRGRVDARGGRGGDGVIHGGSPRGGWSRRSAPGCSGVPRN